MKKIFNPAWWVGNLIKGVRALPSVARAVYLFWSFFVLLLIFIFAKAYRVLELIPFVGRLFMRIHHAWSGSMSHKFDSLIVRLEKTKTSDMRRTYLIDLAFKNLMAKKTRSLITMLGMSVGVGIIVLLLSLGYGMERLIIGRVAGLDELRMMDISAGENTTLRLNADALQKISKLVNVQKAIPLVSVVGRVSYNKATTDVLVYAAPQSYLKTAKVKLQQGKFFSNVQEYDGKKISALSDTGGQVAGASSKLVSATYLAPVTDLAVQFNIIPEQMATVWESCSIPSKLLGYTVRVEGGLNGKEIWGGEYYPFTAGREGVDEKRNIYLGKWIKAKVPLFDKVDDTVMPRLAENGGQMWETGCIQTQFTHIISRYAIGSVLGVSTDSKKPVLLAQATTETTTDVATDEAGLDTTTTATESAMVSVEENVTQGPNGIEFVSLEASSAGTLKKTTPDKLQFTQKPDGEAVVSLGLLNLLNIKTQKAIGTKFNVSFIIVKSLMPEIDGRILTSDVEYKIVGVVDDPDTTYFYIPFSDMSKLAVKNFSQIKVVTTDKNNLAAVRKKIETFGFKTSSTLDTVVQIESLFANLRIILGILGLVALGVASLGMFNTLTVSLLERTREIGGMKTMGMISTEVQDLFLAEAMIMGLSGGVGGLILGYAVGKLISILVSVIAIVNGAGFLDLTYIPFEFTMFILISSFIVGLLTGLYPAMRAKRISALNALRYE